MAKEAGDRIDPSSVVQQHRLRLGLSAAAFARLLGVSPRTVHRWERGEFKVHELWLRRMAELQQPKVDTLVHSVDTKEGERWGTMLTK